MMIRATIRQTIFILKQKGSVFVFYVLLAMVLINYAMNVVTFQGREVVFMYHPMKLLLLSLNRTNYNAEGTMFFVQLYPLLVALPAGFSLARERRSGESVLIAARLGRLSYYFSKFLAAVLATAVVFAVPFLIEILLNCIDFPLNAQGDMSNLDAYDPVYVDRVRNYLFSKLYLHSPYLYAVLMTLLFALVSGLLGGLTVAVSAVVKVKYLAFLFLPAFLLLNATIYLSDLSGGAFATQWYYYLMMFGETDTSRVFLGAAVFLLTDFAVCGIIVGGRRDCLD